MTTEKEQITLIPHPVSDWADWPLGEPKGYENLTPEQQAVLDEKDRAAERLHAKIRDDGTRAD